MKPLMSIAQTEKTMDAWLADSTVTGDPMSSSAQLHYVARGHGDTTIAQKSN